MCQFVGEHASKQKYLGNELSLQWRVTVQNIYCYLELQFFETNTTSTYANRAITHMLINIFKNYFGR